MESVVIQDFCIYHFLRCKKKTHQLVVTFFFDEICRKKNWKIYNINVIKIYNSMSSLLSRKNSNIKRHKISKEFTT